MTGRELALDLRPFELPGVECLLGNVTDPDEMQRAAAGAAVVAHCAAVIAGDDEEMTRVNAEGTRLLVEAALDAGCRRFLHVSTGAVYAFKDRPVVDVVGVARAADHQGRACHAG